MSVKYKRRGVFILGIIFVIGLFLRIWKLNKAPVSLFGDEIDVGLQAYSVLTTGKDYLGNKMPVMFHSFAEYRLPLQLYLDVPFIWAFGLNEFGVRIPAVLMGLVSIISFYFLIRELFGGKLAVVSSLFLTFSPWHFNFSRQANDAGILLPFILLGTYFFLRGRGKYRFLLIASVLFSLSIYTYAISALFIPLYLLGLVLIFRKEVFSYGVKKLAAIIVISLLVLTPYILSTIKGRTTERFSSISFITSQEIEAEVVANRLLLKGPLGRVFYNKATVVLTRFFGNYLQTLSPVFLFSKGDPNPRNSISEFGQMYHYDFFLVLVGLFLIIHEFRQNRSRKSFWIILLWLVLAAIPSSLTKDGGTHAARLILMLPPLIFLSAIGFESLTRIRRPLFRNLIIVLISFTMIFEVSRFMNRYFVIWPKQSWRFWQDGFKETLSFVKSEDKNYYRIYFNSTYEPMLPRFLFWYGYDMRLFQAQFTKDVFSPNIASGFDGFNLGNKYYFGDIKKPIENLAAPGVLVVASGEKDVSNPAIFGRNGPKLLKEVRSPVDIPIFYVYTRY
jgi:4-amino-4-deoxy-L-arabinose transferase-like glycosyltransferase